MPNREQLMMQMSKRKMQDCENDLRELAFQKHKMLEAVIAEKMETIQELESELCKE